MKKAQFVANNRGINNGADLPQEMLEQFYDSIVSNELQIDHERDDILQWELQGYMKVQEVDKKSLISKKTWQRRWCIISGKCLFIFEDPKVRILSGGLEF